jgi:NADH-quinone oxidoreductase subunit C
MTARTEVLIDAVKAALGDRITGITTALGEVTLVVNAVDLTETMTALRDRPELGFEQLIDVCGVDYGSFGKAAWDGEPAAGGGGARFAAVYHLLSLANNWRLRVRAFAVDDDFPVIDSVINIWPAANWFEREAFDLFGIVFDGHPDLRRILTDYGFIGHPFRKDFPISGNVEMRYDPDQRRVIYQPVTIDPREITPRIVREENYADGAGFRKG